MSFTPRYGSSVTRDYTLLQGHPSSYQHFGALGANQQASTNNNASNPNGNEDTHSLHSDAENDDAAASALSINHDDATDNGLSNISLPPNSQAVPTSPAFARSNRLATAPIASPRARRASANAYPQVAGIPSEYLLGGSAHPPTHHPGTASNITLGAPVASSPLIITTSTLALSAKMVTGAPAMILTLPSPHPSSTDALLIIRTPMVLVPSPLLRRSSSSLYGCSQSYRRWSKR